MANTYTSINLHIIFAVKYRDAMLHPLIEKRVFAYIARIINEEGCFADIVGGTSDHVHILLRLSTDAAVSALVRKIKSRSSAFINGNGLTRCKFQWQTGYACLSCSPSHRASVVDYIAHQHEHHNGGVSLRDEISRILTKYGIDFNPDYLPADPEQLSSAP